MGKKDEQVAKQFIHEHSFNRQRGYCDCEWRLCNQ